MPGKFELFEDKSGGYRFNLLASNGQVIASSESYKTRRAAEEGIESVKKNAPEAEVVDRAS